MERITLHEICLIIITVVLVIALFIGWGGA